MDGTVKNPMLDGSVQNCGLAHSPSLTDVLIADLCGGEEGQRARPASKGSAPGPAAGGSTSARKDPLYLAFVFAIAVGLRRGEVVGLRWANVDPDKRVTYVRQVVQRGVLNGDDPNKRRRQAVPMPALCIAPLRRHRMRQAVARRRAGDVEGGSGGYVVTDRSIDRAPQPLPLVRSGRRQLRVIRCAMLGTAAPRC